jgi:hypothetical protein
VLRGLSQLLFVTAGLSFFVGERVNGAFTETERMLAEVEGIGLAVVCGALGFMARRLRQTTLTRATTHPANERNRDSTPAIPGPTSSFQCEFRIVEHPTEFPGIVPL